MWNVNSEAYEAAKADLREFVAKPERFSATGNYSMAERVMGLAEIQARLTSYPPLEVPSIPPPLGVGGAGSIPAYRYPQAIQLSAWYERMLNETQHPTTQGEPND